MQLKAVIKPKAQMPLLRLRLVWLLPLLLRLRRQPRLRLRLLPHRQTWQMPWR
jgi:hypothetical protein